jgi:hypothetical protein
VADYNCPLCGLTEMSNDDGSWKVVKSADVSHLQWTKV